LVQEAAVADPVEMLAEDLVEDLAVAVEECLHYHTC
jgi:hypothetical protein